MGAYATAVNDQITDSVSQASTLVLGSAASQSLGFLNIAGAEALGMLMHNAVNAQQNAQVSASAAATSTCARILQAQMAPPIPPAPKLPPPFTPLSPPALDPNALISQANAMAHAAAAEVTTASTGQISAAELASLIATLQDLQKNLPSNAAAGATTTTAPNTAATSTTTSAASSAPTAAPATGTPAAQTH